jgi:hypothetical protein
MIKNPRQKVWDFFYSFRTAAEHLILRGKTKPWEHRSVPRHSEEKESHVIPRNEGIHSLIPAILKSEF